jgi:two-component system, NtrC family, sensor kinase
VIPQDFGRVLLNLINNAFYAVNERKTQLDMMTDNLKNYQPTVTISTKLVQKKGSAKECEIRVNDNGTGMPEGVRAKIFQPFYTTKPTGQGTGLGLSLAYDIMKAHGGGLDVTSREGEGTEFVITLPI